MQPTQPTQNLGAVAERERLLQELPMQLRGVITPEYWSQLTYEQRELLSDLEQFPADLEGVIPPTMWSTLNIVQKIQILAHNSWIPMPEVAPSVPVESSVQQGFDGPMGTVEISNETSEEPTQSGELEMNQLGGPSPEFAQAVSEVERIEAEARAAQEGSPAVQEPPVEPVSTEDLARIEVEKGAAMAQPTMKFTGYTLPAHVADDPDRFAEQDTNKATTWIANIYNKLRELMNQSAY